MATFIDRQCGQVLEVTHSQDELLFSVFPDARMQQRCTMAKLVNPQTLEGVRSSIGSFAQTVHLYQQKKKENTLLFHLLFDEGFGSFRSSADDRLHVRVLISSKEGTTVLYLSLQDFENLGTYIQ